MIHQRIKGTGFSSPRVRDVIRALCESLTLESLSILTQGNTNREVGALFWYDKWRKRCAPDDNILKCCSSRSKEQCARSLTRQAFFSVFPRRGRRNSLKSNSSIHTNTHSPSVGNGTRRLQKCAARSPICVSNPSSSRRFYSSPYGQ